MAAIYKWSVGNIVAKKSFTDKYGNLRENVIKSVQLIYEGVEEERKEYKEIIVNFPLFDLSSFQDYTQLNKEIVLDWALNKLTQREKSEVESFVKGLFEESDTESNTINIEIDD